MPQLLSVSRAARLVGVTRAALQRKIHNNELQTFEGQIRLTELLRVFPDAQMEDNTMLEKVARIKAHATPNSREKIGLPAPEVLAERISVLSHELADSKSLLRHYSQCAETLLEKLSTLAHTNSAAQADIEALRDWVRKEMQQQPEIQESRRKILAQDSFLRVMAAHVKVIPSGRDFFVEGAQSLLDAALGAGLHMNYGCSNGNCGSCKARLLSGEVHKLRDTEYQISESEKNLGYVLMCSCTAVTDLTLEAREATAVEELPQQTIVAKVEKCETPADDMRILDIRAPRTKSLRFMAGQAITLKLEGAKGDYYLASCPCDGSYLQFHIKRDDSPLAEKVFAGLAEKQTIVLEGPIGDFLLHVEPDGAERLLFMCWEEGIAPIKSMIEHTIAMDTVHHLHMEWFSNRGYYMENFCRAWNDALDNFTYELVDAELDSVTRELNHRLQNLAIAPTQVYIAGPDKFIDAARQALNANNLGNLPVATGALA